MAPQVVVELLNLVKSVVIYLQILSDILFDCRHLLIVSPWRLFLKDSGRFRIDVFGFNVDLH